MNGEDALERYLASLAARDASPHTHRAYATAISGYLGWLDAAGVDWRSPDRTALRAYLAELSEAHARTTVAQRLAAVRSFHRWARRTGIASRDPWSALASPRRARRLPAVLATDEVERLLAAAATEPEAAAASASDGAARARLTALRHALALRDVALVETAYAAGLRISELAAARLGALDLARGEIRVAGKGRKERVSLLGRPARAALASYLADGRPVLLARGDSDPRRADALFVNHRGAPLGRVGSGIVCIAPESARACPTGRRHTPCGTRSPRTCSTGAPTSGWSRSCWAMLTSPPPRCTRTLPRRV